MFVTNLLRIASLAILATKVLAQCDGETSDLICYTSDVGVPQNVLVADVEYCAEYLRAYGAQTLAGRQYVSEYTSFKPSPRPKTRIVQLITSPSDGGECTRLCRVDGVHPRHGSDHGQAYRQHTQLQCALL